MKYDVFISHSSKDKNVADKLCKFLEQHKIICWIAPRDVTAGLPYAQAIMKGIVESELMVLLFSDAANKSRHVESEVNWAFNKEKIIIPYRISDIAMSDTLSYYVGISHYIDGIPNPEACFDDLKQQIERNLSSKQKQVEINELITKLAQLQGITVDKLKEVIENLRTSEEDSIEILINRFIDIQEQLNIKCQNELSNEIGIKGAYSIMQNEKGEIMIMMNARAGSPETPTFLYDGSDGALLYRNSESTVFFSNLDEEARNPLKSVEKILIVEVLGEEAFREYMAHVKIVPDVNLLIAKK